MGDRWLSLEKLSDGCGFAEKGLLQRRKRTKKEGRVGNGSVGPSAMKKGLWHATDHGGDRGPRLRLKKRAATMAEEERRELLFNSTVARSQARWDLPGQVGRPVMFTICFLQEGLAQLVDQKVGQHQVQAEIQKVEGTTFAKISTGKPLVSGWCTAIVQAFERLMAANPPRLGG
ncbi:hypothetical protein B296_00059206 [Ensete ventricosum]|uniref:Uncharacterized protein n=1 Tax=Ensete ventricosum TaxID=4639 RepID=A0A426WY43_ENSVE|nr:hypothetical protein B296_00059206 [Ensete ventricosum]